VNFGSAFYSQRAQTVVTPILPWDQFFPLPLLKPERKTPAFYLIEDRQGGDAAARVARSARARAAAHIFLWLSGLGAYKSRRHLAGHQAPFAARRMGGLSKHRPTSGFFDYSGHENPGLAIHRRYQSGRWLEGGSVAVFEQSCHCGRRGLVIGSSMGAEIALCDGAAVNLAQGGKHARAFARRGCWAGIAGRRGRFHEGTELVGRGFFRRKRRTGYGAIRDQGSFLFLWWPALLAI